MRLIHARDELNVACIWAVLALIRYINWRFTYLLYVRTHFASHCVVFRLRVARVSTVDYTMSVLTFGWASKRARRCQAREFSRWTRLQLRRRQLSRAVSLCLSRSYRLIALPRDHCTTSLRWLPKINRKGMELLNGQKKRPPKVHLVTNYQ